MNCDIQTPIRGKMNKYDHNVQDTWGVFRSPKLNIHGVEETNTKKHDLVNEITTENFPNQRTK